MNGAKVSRATQVGIYLGKHWRLFLNEHGWKVLIFGAVISVLVSVVLGSGMFVYTMETFSGCFTLISACIWIGIFNSIQTICKERAIIKREHRAGLHITSYVASHLIFQAGICLLQAALLLGISSIFLTYPAVSPLFGSVLLEYFVTYFLATYAADVLGLAISAIVKTPTTAMTVMPFVLIIQLILSGMLFSLEGPLAIFGNLTISKWGMNAACISAGVLTIGYDAGGTSNYSWYRVGGMTFQPAELAKISFILTLALHLSQLRGQVNRPKNLLLLLLHILVPPFLIHIQGDDGTALVFLGIGLVMLYAGGISHWLVGGVLAAGVAGGGALLLLKPDLLKGYQFQRIMAILTPEDPALSDITYQQNKGAMAIGTGGLTGQGLFRGDHIFVPNAWNDFIFAYLANVLGFVGAAAALILLFVLCMRTLRTALRSADALGRDICSGIFAALFVQCVINLGMNLQVLPVIGVTLPFFSAGGSSVVMMYLCVGLVLSVGMHARSSHLKAGPVL